MYDPRVGRFLSPDPLSQHFPYYSPYQYAGNKPIWAKDLDGAEEVIPLEFLLSTDEIDVGGTETIVEPKITPSPGTAPSPASSASQGLSNWRVDPSGSLRWVDPKPWTPFDVVAPWIQHYQPQLKKSDANQTAAPKQSAQTDPQPKPNPQRQFDPHQQPTKEDDDNEKTFYVTYTKTKVLADGTVSVYSGRTSGTYTGIAPTAKEAQDAVNRRDAGHDILRKEKYAPAVLDKYSTNYDAIRGREQQQIDRNGGAQSEGGTSRNKIRAVRRNNPNRRNYEAAATRAFGKLPNNNPADRNNP